jgi:hypothetical protein
MVISPRLCTSTDTDGQYNDHEDKRPGGNTSIVPVKSSSASTNETYHLVGDAASVRAVLAALISNCSAQDTTSQIAVFARDASVPAVYPEQAVQYYRASSFALTLDGYNNSASLVGNQPADNNTAPPDVADTPLPGSLNMAFLECVNVTTAFALPVVDGPHKLGGGEIAGIVIGSVVGAVLLALGLFWCCVSGRRRMSTSKTRRGSRYNSLLTPPTLGEASAGKQPPVTMELTEEPHTMPLPKLS